MILFWGTQCFPQFVCLAVGCSVRLVTTCFPCCPFLFFSLVSVSLHFHSVMPCWLSDAVIRNEIQRIPRNLFVTKVLAPKNRAFWLQKNRAEVPRKPWSFSRSWNFFWFEMIWEQMPFWSWNLPGFDAESVGVQVPQRNLLKPDIQVPQSLEKLENLPSQVISHPFGLGLMPHGVQVSQRNLASPSSPFVYPISLWCRRCHVLHCSRHG